MYSKNWTKTHYKCRKNILIPVDFLDVNWQKCSTCKLRIVLFEDISEDCSPGRQPLSTDKLFQRGKGGAGIYRSFSWKNVVQYQKITANHQKKRHQVSDFSAFLFMRRGKSLGSLKLLLRNVSYLGPVSCSSPFRITLRVHHWGQLRWLRAWQWAKFTDYWNGRQLFLFVLNLLAAQHVGS